MIVWTWIKRISCLIGKSIWFLFAKGCFFGLMYLMILVVFPITAIVKGNNEFVLIGIVMAIALFILHRIVLIVVYSGQPWDRAERNERQRTKIEKYALLVRECLTMK